MVFLIQENKYIPFALELDEALLKMRASAYPRVCNRSMIVVFT